MNAAEQKAYNRGVRDALAIARATATRLADSPISPMRRELAIETLRAVAVEAAALLRTQGDVDV